MNPAELRSEIKRLIVRELNLKGRDPETIEDEAPLFGAGLGLDSLDALQLAMSIEEQLGVRIPEGDEARSVFQRARDRRSRGEGAKRVTMRALGDRAGAGDASRSRGRSHVVPSGPRGPRHRAADALRRRGAARRDGGRGAGRHAARRAARRVVAYERHGALGGDRGDRRRRASTSPAPRVGLVVGGTHRGNVRDRAAPRAPCTRSRRTREALVAMLAASADVDRRPPRRPSRAPSRAPGRSRAPARAEPTRSSSPPRGSSRARSTRSSPAGADGLCRLTVTGFNALGAIDPDPCRPFDRRRRGTTLGEGAGFLVLERADAARRRRAEPVAELAGWAIGSEAHHITNPAADGVVVGGLVGRAIERARLTPADVDYVNAHGTGTPANDAMEAAALANGARRRRASRPRLEQQGPDRPYARRRRSDRGGDHRARRRPAHARPDRGPRGARPGASSGARSRRRSLRPARSRRALERFRLRRNGRRCWR